MKKTNINHLYKSFYQVQVRIHFYSHIQNFPLYLYSWTDTLVLVQNTRQDLEIFIIFELKKRNICIFNAEFKSK